LSSSLGFFPSSSSCALGFLLPISSPSISRGSAHSASVSLFCVAELASSRPRGGL
jgi:hypothetical protein